MNALSNGLTDISNYRVALLLKRVYGLKGLCSKGKGGVMVKIIALIPQQDIN